MNHTIIANRTDEPPLVLQVASDLPTCELTDAVKAAVSDFVTSGTDEAENALSTTSGQFNWGDTALWLPDEYAKRHGFRIASSAVADLIVNHDDSLMPDMA